MYLSCIIIYSRLHRGKISIAPKSALPKENIDQQEGPEGGMPAHAVNAAAYKGQGRTLFICALEWQGEEQCVNQRGGGNKRPDDGQNSEKAEIQAAGIFYAQRCGQSQQCTAQGEEGIYYTLVPFYLV